MFQGHSSAQNKCCGTSLYAGVPLSWSLPWVPTVLMSFSSFTVGLLFHHCCRALQEGRATLESLVSIFGFSQRWTVTTATFHTTPPRRYILICNVSASRPQYHFCCGTSVSPRFLLNIDRMFSVLSKFWSSPCSKSKCQNDQRTVLRTSASYLTMWGSYRNPWAPRLCILRIYLSFSSLLPPWDKPLLSCRIDQLYSYLVLQQELKFSLPLVGLGKWNWREDLVGIIYLFIWDLSSESQFQSSEAYLYGFHFIESHFANSSWFHTCY